MMYKYKVCPICVIHSFQFETIEFVILSYLHTLNEVLLKWKQFSSISRSFHFRVCRWMIDSLRSNLCIVLNYSLCVVWPLFKFVLFINIMLLRYVKPQFYLKLSRKLSHFRLDICDSKLIVSYQSLLAYLIYSLKQFPSKIHCLSPCFVMLTIHRCCGQRLISLISGRTCNGKKKLHCHAFWWPVSSQQSYLLSRINK